MISLIDLQSYSQKNKLLLFFITCLVLLSVWASYKNFDRVVIRSDGTGYFEYLPSLIGENDPWLKDIRSRRIHEIKPTILYNTLEGRDGRRAIKYPMGVAILWSPFYAGASIYAKIFHLPEYSTPYQVAVAVAAIFYLLSGFFILRYLIQKYYSLDEASIILVLAPFILGTNLFHYATFDASFSHIYAFFSVSLWLLALDYYFERNGDLRSIFFLAASVSLMFLVRYINVMFSLLFVAEYIRRKDFSGIAVGKVVVVAVVASVFVFPQFLYYFLATGEWVISPYASRSETFTGLLSPEWYLVLLSPGRGLLVWVPYVLLSVIGYYYDMKFRREYLRVFAIMLVCFTSVYLIASWWSPHFGAGLGHRGFIELYPLFIFGYAAFIKEQGVLVKRGVALISVLWICFSFCKMIGYWHGIIPYSDVNWVHIRNTIELILANPAAYFL